VTRNAIGGGPAAAFFTTIGILVANALYALGAALGLSVVLARSASALEAIKVGGAVYLAVLGLSTLWRAVRAPARVPVRADVGCLTCPAGVSPLARFGEGVVTNLLNPPVPLFYVSYVPQFIGPGDPHFRTFMTLAAIHLAIAFTWLSFYGTSVGALGAVLGRPRVKRGIEAATGLALMFLAWKLGFSRA
jgi:threonine/homoserine/homoserine lactone efflux protein